MDKIIKGRLEEIAIEKKELRQKINNLNKMELELCEIVNRSAIFDEKIIFQLAKLLSLKEQHSYTPFIYKKSKLIYEECVEEVYFGIASEEDMLEFANNSDNIYDFFENRIGYVVFRREAKLQELEDDEEGIIFEKEELEKKVLFDFLLVDYGITNTYPVSKSFYNFEDYEYIQGFIKYLFNLQLNNYGIQLTFDEMNQAMIDYLELEKDDVRARE